jgi:SAM-dependent methyltransferase
MTEELPDYLFARQDESSDEQFYAMPRFTKHIDDETISALTQHYRETFSPDHALLDLMSSWISHLPPEIKYKSVTGLGMNAEELAGNPRLDESIVQNLNDQPALPFTDQQFDAVMIAVSVQYLTRPFDVFTEIARVLKPGGRCIVAMSHRLFPTKAIYAFQALGPADRFELVKRYMQHSGAIEDIEFIDRSPDAADPLWIVQGARY